MASCLAVCPGAECRKDPELIMVICYVLESSTWLLKIPRLVVLFDSMKLICVQLMPAEFHTTKDGTYPTARFNEKYCNSDDQ